MRQAYKGECKCPGTVLLPACCSCTLVPAPTSHYPWWLLSVSSGNTKVCHRHPAPVPFFALSLSSVSITDAHYLQSSRGLLYCHCSSRKWRGATGMVSGLSDKGMLFPCRHGKHVLTTVIFHVGPESGCLAIHLPKYFTVLLLATFRFPDSVQKPDRKQPFFLHSLSF